MPYFAYEGRNARGEPVNGVLEGPSSATIADQLLNLGVTPLRIDETASKGSVKESAARLREQPIGLVDLMLFCRQMHTLLRSGVPIIRALAGLQESTTNQSFARVLKTLRDGLESGRELSACLQQDRKVFPQILVSIVRVGEMTGHLDEVFNRLYQFFAFEKHIREQIKSALRYPVLVILAMAAALFIVNIFVIPAFAKLFASFQAKLPLPTRILIETSNFFVGYWPFLLGGLALGVVAFRMYTATPAGRYAWDRRKLRLPVVGELIYKATLARFSRSFALASRSGVPIVQALAVVSDVVDNAYIKQRIVEMREGIERGDSILRTATAAGVFNSLVLQMIAVGEETGEIDAMMEDIADMYEQEVKLEVDALAAKIEPILLVVMGVMVLILALGIFLPMWELANAARGGRGR